MVVLVLVGAPPAGGARPGCAVSPSAGGRRRPGGPAGPAARPGGGPAGARSCSSGMRLTMTVMWLVRLRIRVARPRARGRHRLMVGALVGEAGRHVELLGIELVVVLGVGDRRVQHLADREGGVALGEAQDVLGLVHRPGRGPGRAPRGPCRATPGRGAARPGCPRARWSWGQAISASPAALGRRGSGRSGSGRTRPACGRPSTR